MSSLLQNLDTCNQVINAGRSQAASWDEIAHRYDNALLGERLIVIDRHDRAFAQGSGTYTLSPTINGLQGVSHMNAENAAKVVKTLSADVPEAAPFVAVDFKDYALSHVDQSASAVITAQRAKDLLLAPYMDVESFRDFAYVAGNQLDEYAANCNPRDEIPEHIKHSEKVLAAAPYTITGDGHIEPKDGALVLFGEKLSPIELEALAAFRDKHGADWQEELSLQWQQGSYPGMSDYGSVLQTLRNERGPEWLVSATEQPDTPTKAIVNGHLVFEIDNTDNAAFADAGREAEVGRIVRDAAKVVSQVEFQAIDRVLFDLNGNSVGRFQWQERGQLQELEPGAVRIHVYLDTANWADDPKHEVSRAFELAAERFERGDTEFSVRDSLGSTIAKASFVEHPSIEHDGRIDLAAALKAGNVYKAEDSFSGIADGEYRYVVPQFDIGYHIGTGQGYLVNAAGEVASGYENGGSEVDEKQLSVLTSEEVAALTDVLSGKVSLETHEHRFAGEQNDIV